MKNLIYAKRLSSLLCLLFMAGITLVGQGRIAGTVYDESGEGLIGANLIVEGTTEGTVTDFDGTFSFNTTQSFPLTLVVSFTGYTTQDIELSGPTSDLSITLSEGILLGDDVVISASRRREKIQEAPASISVLSARKLAASANDNPARNLINMPGVTIQQQSAARINIQLRGDGGLFGSASFPIIDYRSLSGPGLGTFDVLNSPLNNIDIQRIEVVRGPGSALYGPDVTSGVVHFITKSPIDVPGTTVELIGGELSTFGASVRHATKVSDKFGFKINGVLKRGNEFTLDINDPQDAAQIARFQTSVSSPAVTDGIVDATRPGTVLLTQADLDPDGDGNVMQDDWRQFSLTTTLEFRPADDLSINLAGGTNSASSVFYNSQGEGLSQATEYWWQARFQKGGLFGQLFWLSNDGGPDDNPTFLYQTGNTTRVDRTQLEGQLQYNGDIPSFLNSNWTVGIDYRQSVANTFNQVYGRNEEDDDFSIFGGYVQGKFELGQKLDLVLAGRIDQFNFVDETAFQPRAVLVYKPSPKHTVRFGYNRAVGSPTQLQANIDFPVATVVPGAFDVWLAGNREPHTFGSNPTIQLNGLLGGINLPIGTPGLPNAVVYGAVNELVLAQLVPGIVGALQAGGADAATANGVAGAIADYLRNPANSPGGTTGQFFGVNLFNGQPLGLLDAPAIQLRKEDTWEFGYKGLIADKLGVLLDVYNRRIDGSTLFTAISPGYTLLGSENIGSDLGAAVGNSAFRDFVFGILGGAANPAAGPTADLLTSAVQGAYAGGGDAFAGNIAPLIAGAVLATTPTDRVPTNGVTHLAAGYRTFEAFDYTGLDFGLEYYISDDLSIYGNYSWLSDNVFQPVIKGTDGGTERTSISAPLNKFRMGFNYAPEFGWRANMNFQHDDSYEVFLGQFSGLTDERNLVDAGVGYKFDSGLSLDVSAQNLFDTEYRYFPNFPKLGRRVLGKLTYTFGADGPSDVDGDGIKDKKDACPNEAGTKEFRGCPDTDGDGIIDKDDSCPMAAGDILYGGCPDSDGDGVIDKEDDCPNDAGTLGGCPDADGDGVADKDDNCPNDAGTLGGCPDSDGDGVVDKDDNCPNDSGNVGGCPDGDGDGVADKDDKCPTVSARTSDGCPADPDGDGVAGAADLCPNEGGIVDENGCPKDSDGDGIVDNDDKCPNVGGIIGPDGCAKPVPEKAAAIFTRALEGVKFQSARATLTRSSYSILDEVVAVMAEFPDLILSIQGHTDAQGDDDKNLELSKSRADSVMKYLVDKGVDATRLSTIGLGETSPIASNDSPAGRAQNRRVEFVVVR